ncbi:MAG: RloB domain-containing protein [Opitutaceae bacterium]|nr:RloB domain-containing protein [Opitutaceae bacterium]
MLILCEDEKSSCDYFKAFPIDRRRIRVETVGTGYNTDTLIKEAVRLKTAAEKAGEPFNEVYCVFDRDDFPAGNFNQAFQRAAKHGIHAIWTNEAFELWYLLHFDLITTALPRAKYAARLKAKLGVAYRKNDRTLYEKLKDRQGDAFRFSAGLARHWAELAGGCNPETCNPSTNVADLVTFLNELVELGGRT